MTAARCWADSQDILRISEHQKNIHDMLSNMVARQCGDKGQELRSTLQDLCALRVTADYKPESVDKNDLISILERAQEAKRYFLGERK
jgi:hypothetical protein